MPVSCHFQGCKALLRTVKRRYIKYHAFAFLTAPSLMFLVYDVGVYLPQ